MLQLIKYSKFCITECEQWLEFALNHIPGETGTLLRRMYWGKKIRACGEKLQLSTDIRITGADSITIGNECRIDKSSKILAHEGGMIRIGDRVSITTNVHVGAANNGKIILGDNVFIGPNVVLRASNHEFASTDIPMRDQGHRGGSIIIENDVWIGANAVVLPDVCIRCGSIIGAGAVVTGDVPAWSIMGGVPARILKKRKPEPSKE